MVVAKLLVATPIGPSESKLPSVPSVMVDPAEGGTAAIEVSTMPSISVKSRSSFISGSPGSSTGVGRGRDTPLEEGLIGTGPFDVFVRRLVDSNGSSGRLWSDMWDAEFDIREELEACEPDTEARSAGSKEGLKSAMESTVSLKTF